jgi:hypothetical protein
MNMAAAIVLFANGVIHAALFVHSSHWEELALAVLFFATSALYLDKVAKKEV